MRINKLVNDSGRLAVGLSLLFAIFLAAAGCGSFAGSTGNAATTDAKKKEPVTPAQATFLAGGDIMLSRGVARAMDSRNDPDLPFSKMTSVFKAADFCFANFESPVSGNDRVLGKGLVFNVQERNVAGLVRNNFKIVGLANNHSMDQGVNGMRHTKAFLTEKGIINMGTGENLDEAWAGKVIEANGIKFGFIAVSYASINDGGVARNPYVARIEEKDRLKASIEKMRAEADIVVVAFHAGIEYTRKPHQPQIDFAHAAIDFGADIAIGAHPHWIQTLEEYKGKYIFYSLGNFIFDQRQPGTTEGMMLRITARRKDRGSEPPTKIDEIELVPVIVAPGGIPSVANEAEAKAIFQKIGVEGAKLPVK